MLTLHPIHYIVIGITQSIILGLTTKYWYYLISIAFTIFNISLVGKGAKLFSISKLFISLLPAVIGIFFTSYLFGGSEMGRLSLAINISLKIFCLSIVSIVCLTKLPYEKLVVDLMKRKVLKIQLGYALLSVGRSFSIIKNNLSKIRYTTKARKIGFFSITIPLMISMVKHSQNQAISLYSRGLSQKKTFQQSLIPFGINDFLILFIQIIFLSLSIYNKIYIL